MDRQAALRRDAPSARGVDAAGIAAFLDAAAEHELHGLMIWRDGAVVARQTGAASPAALRAWVESSLGEA